MSQLDRIVVAKTFSVGNFFVLGLILPHAVVFGEIAVLTEALAVVKFFYVDTRPCFLGPVLSSVTLAAHIL